MNENPFSPDPTTFDEVEEQEDDGPGFEPTKVKENYDRVPPEGNEVEDDVADEEWAQTPVGLFGSLDDDDFWWVFVTLEGYFAESGDYKNKPVVQERFDTYDELVDARNDTDEEIPEGIHVQLKDSTKIRYVKGQDETELLDRRGLND